MMNQLLLTAACLLLVAETSAKAPVPGFPNPRCQELSFKVNGIPSNVTAPDANATLSAGSSPNGTQTYGGWYCEPWVQNENSTKLQLFRGSFFTNRESWTALGGTALFYPPLVAYEPCNYSWFDYANELGYPTLAIDSLGDGASSSPDPILLATIPYEVSLYHDLITQIRAGTTGQLPRKFSTIFHIGNSVGSQIGNNLAARYPLDIDAYVLTGYSKNVTPSFPGVSLNAPLPAVLQEPQRFAGKPLGYVTSSIEQSLINSFFGSPNYSYYDPFVAQLFFQRRDTVALGIALTTYMSPRFQPVAPNYTGRVLLLTGENDQAYCGMGSSALSPAAACGGLLAATGSLFPKADYNWKSVPKTGHALVLHYSARHSFEVAHHFLAGASYKG